MREFFQSCSTLAFTMSLLSVELMDRITLMEEGELKGPATKALDAVSNAAVDQLGPRLHSTFRSLNDVQRDVVGIMFDLSLELAGNSLTWIVDGRGPDRHQTALSDRLEVRSEAGRSPGTGGIGNNKRKALDRTRPQS